MKPDDFFVVVVKIAVLLRSGKVFSTERSVCMSTSPVGKQERLSASQNDL